MVVPDEDVGLAIADPFVDPRRRSGDHEQFAAIDLDLGHLVRGQGVLYRKGMQVVALDQDVELLVGRVIKTDPDELARFKPQPLGRQRRLAHALAVTIDIRGDDRHGRSVGDPPQT